jgi:hypothetical protein
LIGCAIAGSILRWENRAKSSTKKRADEPETKMRLALLALILSGAILDLRPAAAEDYDDGQAARTRGDYAATARIWRPLAEQGDAGSQNGLSVLYQLGEGVEKDGAEAMKWYRRAAAQG